jgi:hypothetical protein
MYVVWNGSTRIIETGSFVPGPIGVNAPGCPYNIGCVASACFFPTFGIVANPSVSITCSFVTYEKGQCGEGQCYARAFCGGTVVAQGCVNYPICGGFLSPDDSKDFNLFKALGLKEIIYTDQKLLELVNAKSVEIKVENMEVQDSQGKVLQKNEIKNIAFNIYPNPFSEIFNLKIESPERTEIKMDLRNVLGSTVYSKIISLEEGVNEKVINVQNLPSSIYFVNIYQNGLLIGTEKIIKE